VLSFSEIRPRPAIPGPLPSKSTPGQGLGPGAAILARNGGKKVGHWQENEAGKRLIFSDSLSNDFPLWLRYRAEDPLYVRNTKAPHLDVYVLKTGSYGATEFPVQWVPNWSRRIGAAESLKNILDNLPGCAILPLIANTSGSPFENGMGAP
jgi:hypothetical protein